MDGKYIVLIEYFIFCIDEIYGFIGWVWTFHFVPDPALGLAIRVSALR